MTEAVRARLRSLALLASCCAAAACGGGSGSAGADAADVAGKLVPAGAHGLIVHYRERLSASRSLPRWSGPPPALPASGGAGGTVPPASEPFVQEPGIDEPDVVRVAGDTVWGLTPPGPDGVQRLRAFRIADGGARLDPAGSLALDAGVRYDGLFVDRSRGRVIVVSDGDGAGTAASPEATLVFVDATDPSAPRTASTLRLGGRLTAARIADGRIWTVVRNRPAVEGFDRRWLDPAANDRWLAGLTADAVLPSLRVDGSPPRPLAPPEACLLQPGAVEDPYEVTPVTTIAAFDLAAPDAPPLARCVAAPVDTVLVSRGTLVAAASRWTLVDAGDGTGAALGERVTDVHRFALSSASIAYRGSATVPGRLDRGRDTGRFMMSIDGPRLRVLTQRDAPGSAGPAHLTVLEDRGVGDLATVSTLPNARRPEPIGKPGEQVHAVRFVGTRAYVVTFLRIDPVYAIDLSDPTDPRVLGALEVPGFSDRLYPVADGLLLGLGYDTTGGQGFDLPGGVLVSLIDVRDPARPVERARRVLGQRGSGSAADLSPLGTTIRIAGDRVRIALPVWVHEGAAWPSSWSEPESLRPRDFSRLAAYRWNVDPATATLSDAPPVVAPDASTDGVAPMRGRAGASRAFDRAIDVGDTTWLWYDGRFAAGAW